MTDKKNESPCIGVCLLDENDVCVGCNRTVFEIFNAGHEEQWPTQGSDTEEHY